VSAKRWDQAIEHLRTVDPRWSPIVDRVGPCLLRPKRDPFNTLVRAIIGQQISTTAAQTVDKRLRLLSGDPHHPKRLIDTGHDGLRSCGLSGVKSRYILNLAEAVHEGHLPVTRLSRLTDDQIKEKLTAIKGIGPWTAEMFLIFSLNRPDVLSSGDLGIRVGLRDFHGLPEMPKPSECEALTDAWRPYRSVAMWYLWRMIDTPKPSA
jgi:DNA-3-methyladenine glycosylase II